MLALGRYIPPDSTPKSTAKTPQISPNAPGRQKHTRHDHFPLLRFCIQLYTSISRQHRFGRCRVDIDEHHTETGRCIFDAIGRSADPTARGNGIRKVSRLSPKVNARIAYTLVSPTQGHRLRVRFLVAAAGSWPQSGSRRISPVADYQAPTSC